MSTIKNNSADETEVQENSQELPDDYMDNLDYDYQQLLPSESFNGNYYTSRVFYNDYEDGSFNEFINLVRQRDRREQITADWDNNNALMGTSMMRIEYFLFA